MVTLPYNWRPRDYQLDAWLALESGVRRAILLWHRRAGKDEVALHWTACQMVQQPGNYWHMLPQANQARRAIWDAVDPHSGQRRIYRTFPRELIRRVRENDMLIELTNGSTWQLVGGDNFDSLVGASPRGIVFSEFALTDPGAWEYLAPILRENGGWAIFPTTPRGKNHLFKLWQSVQGDKAWLCDKRTVEDTSVFSADDIALERADGKDEAIIQQEYYCSFDSPNQGSYYAKEMEKVRICPVPVTPGVDCVTAWDLGVSDATSIWVIQPVGMELRVVAYYEQSGEGLAHYANWVKEFSAEHQVRFREHILPHDVKVRDLSTGMSREQALLDMGVMPVSIAPQTSVADGIEAVRRLLPRCVFDQERTKRGRMALAEYGRDWDARNQCWKSTPRHDWSSHGADAFRYLAVGMVDRSLTAQRPRVRGGLR